MNSNQNGLKGNKIRCSSRHIFKENLCQKLHVTLSRENISAVTNQTFLSLWRLVRFPHRVFEFHFKISRFLSWLSCFIFRQICLLFWRHEPTCRFTFIFFLAPFSSLPLFISFSFFLYYIHLFLQCSFYFLSALFLLYFFFLISFFIRHSFFFFLCVLGFSFIPLSLRNLNFLISFWPFRSTYFPFLTCGNSLFVYFFFVPFFLSKWSLIYSFLFYFNWLAYVHFFQFKLFRFSTLSIFSLSFFLFLFLSFF